MSKKVLFVVGSLREKSFNKTVAEYISKKLEKKGNTYQLIFYGYDPETQKSSKETSTLKVYKKIYLIDKNGIVYGYDTAKKKVAFLREDLEVIYYED